MPRPGRLLPGLLPLAFLATGCSGEAPSRGANGDGPVSLLSPSASSSPFGSDTGVKQGGPLVVLPNCDAPPQPVDVPRVEGLLLPPGAVVTKVSRSDTLVTVSAYVPSNPVRIRQFYRKADIRILMLEDEVYEAEAFFVAGRYRSFVKARAICETGSTVVAVVAPEP